MPPRRNYSAEKQALLASAELARNAPLGERPPAPTPSYFEKHQDEIDDRAYGSDARFIHGHNGQMSMKSDHDYDEYKLPDTTVVQHSDGGTSTHPAGLESEPYARRPEPQGKQLPLGKSGAFRPTDPALHAIRLQNPHLHDYSFGISGTSHGYHTVNAYHHAEDGLRMAGSFSWRGKDHAERSGEAHRAGEIEMIELKDQHKGKGLGTAMWDYAHFHAGREGSDVGHPVHSENRSIEGNHWAHFVGGASMARTKGFNVQRYE